MAEDVSSWEMSESDTGAIGHPAASDDEAASGSGARSTLGEELDEDQEWLEELLLEFVELYFGDFDWDLSDDPELMEMLMRG